LVSDAEAAEKELAKNHFELVIVMPGTDNSNVFDIARSIKVAYPKTRLVVLTPFSHGISKRMEHEDLSIFEYVFCWLGNTELLISIIKLMEDKMNLEHDIRESGVHMILLVEDSIRFYSAILPNLYRYVLEQMHAFATEGLNVHEANLRKRGRPKIVLARNYEEAMDLYNRFKDNTLGVISDARYLRDGVVDPEAGVKFLTSIREQDEYIPLVLQSSESENKKLAKKIGATFVDKNSKTMDLDLRKIVENDFGFGDLVFRDPKTMEEIVRVHNLRDLQDNIMTIPRESLEMHVSHNNISRWLCSRAMFSMSEFLKQITWRENQDIDSHRQIIFDAIVQYRRMKNQGVVAVFLRERFDRYSNFARIGEGSLGGKGRGLAFIGNILKHHEEFDAFDNVDVLIPKTVVLCTDIFDKFMESNDLYHVALSDAEDQTILDAFLKGKLPSSLEEDFRTFISVVHAPIAIRSSSLLEDSHYQPFAGIYSTYMIPYLDDSEVMLRQLSDAVKAVYASVYYKDSKAYMEVTNNVIDQEKMAVVLQEVVGTQYGEYYYPAISGVARSTNHYPLGDEKPEEGVVNLALGLGKYIVDGGQTLRVSPYHPDKCLQTSEMEICLRETQTKFYAIDVKRQPTDFKVDDEDFDDIDLSDDDNSTADSNVVEQVNVEENMKAFQASVTEKIRPVTQKFDLSSFTLIKQPISISATTLGETKPAASMCWALPNSDQFIAMREFTGKEIEQLGDTSGTNRFQTMKNRYKLIYDHVVSKKADTLEAWLKSISYSDNDHLFFCVYGANFAGSNFIPYDCSKCQNTFLSDNIDLMDMCKFKDDEAKARVEKLRNSQDSSISSGLYVSEVTQISDKIAIGFRDPSIWNIVFETSLLDDKFQQKYRDIIAIISYIDKIYFIDSQNKTMQAINYKVDMNNTVKTIKAKIITYAKILVQLSPDQYYSILSYINAVNTRRDDVTYIRPEATCSNCGEIIPERETTAEELVFTRSQLATLAITSIN
jgi:hypothetical protein